MADEDWEKVAEEIISCTCGVDVPIPWLARVRPASTHLDIRADMSAVEAHAHAHEGGDRLG